MKNTEITYIDSDSDDAKSVNSDVVLISEGSQSMGGTLSRARSFESFMGSQATEPPSSQPVEPDSDVGYDDEEVGIGGNAMASRGTLNGLMDDSDDDLRFDFSKMRRDEARRRLSSVSMVGFNVC
jgi:hypothetical protein